MLECLNLLCARMYGSCLDVDKMPLVIKTATQHLPPPTPPHLPLVHIYAVFIQYPVRIADP
jgi:hypothetical protein